MYDDETDPPPPRQRRRLLRSTLLTLGLVAVLAVIFRGVILRHLTHAVALHFAAKENLKLEFQIDGSVLGGVTLKNIHAIATGPSAIQSLDGTRIDLSYSIFDFLFHGASDLIKNVELDSISVVIDPRKAPTSPPKKKSGPFKLPAVFPERVQLDNVNVTVRGEPKDTVVRNLNLGLFPDRAGQLRIDQLQIPGVPTWNNLVASTSYANRNLVLQNFVIDTRLSFRAIEIDASKIGAGEISLHVDGSLGKGKIAGKANVRTTKRSPAIDTDFDLTALSLEDLSASLGQDPLAGEITHAKLAWKGIADEPRSWSGNVVARVENFHQNNFHLDDVVFEMAASNGAVSFRDARIDAGKNHVRLSGSLELPKSIQDFAQATGNFQLAVNAPDLESLTTFLKTPFSGSLAAEGDLKLHDGTGELNVTANARALNSADFAATDLTARIVAAKKLASPNEPDTPFFQNLSSNIHGELAGLRFQDYRLDHLEANVKSNGAAVSIESAKLTRNSNTLLVRGNYQLPGPRQRATKQPSDIQFSWRAAELGDYWADDSANRVFGQLQADGEVRLRGGIAGGSIALFGQNIAAKKLLVRQVDAQITIANNVAYLNDVKATMNEKDFVAVEGTVELQKPYGYSGNFAANLADLSQFKPLLDSTGNARPLAGSVVVKWSGKGEAANFKNSGDIKIKLEKGRFADLQNLQADVSAAYTPDGFDIPIIFLGSDKMDFQAIAQAKGETLEISKIQIDQGQSKYATGYLSLPFVWKNLGSARSLFPSAGRTDAFFQSENLDLQKLFQDFGIAAPMSGTANINLNAKGTLADLQSQFTVQLHDLRSPKYPQLEPAAFDLTARVEGNQLLVSGKLQQAKIQPLSIDARFPIDVAKTLDTKSLDPKTPLSAKVNLPRSSVNFVRQFVPALAELDGDVALDVNVNGTIAKPILGGTGDMAVNVMRFTNPTLPAVQSFKARLVFDRDTLSLAQFGGQIAGGPFSLSGKISFPKLTQPNLDLRLKADSVLVARNDSLTARADADVRVSGAFNAATVTGSVALTNSEFLKNIDLIPIGLPGRPAPQPPESRPVLTFPNPPLRDWKFDVALKTKDPFLIRGNLAQGGAVVDLKFIGTGLHPGLQGIVRLKDVEATLPFSRLEISYGYLYFDPDDSLNPKIDLHGTSLVRDYTVHVYVYGTSLDPQAIFTSEPPLPQEDIISLLATGTTREELTGNNNVLAGRAAMLLVQQLYRKVFKKGQATQSNSVFDKLQVDLGNVDPKTGQQTATARFKINQHFMLVGDIEVGGDFRGMVKYLLRFK